MSQSFNPSFSPPQGSFPQSAVSMGYVRDEACLGWVPMPLHQPSQPHLYNQAAGICNPISHKSYGNYSLMPPIDPFTDYSFSLEAPQNLMRPPPLFSMPLSQMNAGVPRVMYPSPPSLPSSGGIPDHRLLPMIPFEFSQHQPHFFLPSPPQMVFASQVPSLHPSGAGSLVNVTSSFGNQVPRQDSFPTGTAIPPSPRPSRHGRSPLIRPPRQHVTSVTALPHGHRARLPVGARSALMESFHDSNTKDKQWTLQDIFGHIVEFSRDQNGSRLIQQQLQEVDDDDRERVFEEIFPEKIDMLIQDVFGNYVVQKFFDVGTAAQKRAISLVVENKVVSYTVQIYACRVVQKAFEYMIQDQQDRIIHRLEEDFLPCIKDDHGNHVIQKLIDSVAPDRLTFLRIVSANILDLATNSNGCRVLQKCLLKLPTLYIQPVLDAIHAHTGTLMVDQYGNYVIQFILQNYADDNRTKVLSWLRGSVVKLATNQYASHVCEKAITHADALTRHLLIGEILSPTAGDHPILLMMKDDFANYVLQTALMKSEGQQAVELYQEVKAYLAPLRKTSSVQCKQLVKIERLVDKYLQLTSS